MELELPKRLYAEGLEPQVKKINNCCRMQLIRDLKKAMSTDYDDVKNDPVFTHIMAIAENKLKFLGKLVDSFICRQLITSKMHEKWFVFARTPLWFSLQEYHAVTGLKISREGSSSVVKLKNDGGFWSELLRTGGKISLQSIKKARTKLGKKDSYIFEGFSYAILIWLMEAIPDFGEICGKRVSGSFIGPMCGNWKGVAKVSYQDITKLENSFTDEIDLFSVISVTGNGDMFLHTDYTRKGEMEDEQVNLILDRIRDKFDWSNTEWPVIEPEETEIEEAVTKDIDAEAGNSVDATDVVADEETSLVEVPGKGKRKSMDRKTKSFIEGLIHTSVTSLGDMLSTKMENMERMFTERMGKMESEVSQLRDANSLSAEGNDPSMSEAEQDLLKSKGDQAASKSKGDQAASKSKGNQAPSKRKGDRAPPKSKGDPATGTKHAGKKIAVETNDFDFGLSTQDVRDLSQATFVDDFDLSQVKVENTRKSRPFDMSTRHLVDDTRGAAAETGPDAALVILAEEDWEKVTKWSTSSIPLRCGPIILDHVIAKRLMDPSEWLHNWEIDAAMFVFRNLPLPSIS
ncbi:hypothetical protein Bca4012_019716 [Brassica carinata]